MRDLQSALRRVPLTANSTLMHHVAMNLRRIHPIRSGVEAYIDGLVGALARRDDVVVHAVVPSASTPLPAHVVRELETLDEAAGLHEKVWYDFVRAGTAACRSGAVLYHGVDTFLPAGVSRAMTCVVNVHDLGYYRHPELFDRKTRWLNRWHAQLQLRRADHFIALSSLTADDLMQLLGIEARRITVVPAAHDTYFSIDAQDVLVEPPFMLAVGGTNPRKNLERVMTAFAAWRGRGGARDSVQLRIAGGIDPTMRRRADALRKENVVLEGFVSRERLRTLYRNARGLLFPALYEGFGIPILEAMACGAPVLTTGSGATLEVATDAAVGVDPLDVMSIARGIERLHTSGSELRAAGRARASAFSWERTAELTAGVYGRYAR